MCTFYNTSDSVQRPEPPIGLYSRPYAPLDQGLRRTALQPPEPLAEQRDGMPHEPEPDPSTQLPTDEQRLAPAIVMYWRIGAMIPATVVSVVMLGAAAGLGGAAWVAALAVVVAVVATALLVPALSYRHWRWRLTGQALELRWGIVWRHVRAIPYFRIQHIDVEHGPLDRLLGLARLEVHSASVTASLPGLDGEEAPRIRTMLLELAGSAVDRAEQHDDAV